MTTTIALAGKGGTGKTTVAGLLIRSLARRRRGPVLAIDADPSSNLNLVLGLPLTTTVGEIREEMLARAGQPQGEIGTGVTRRDFLETEIRYALEEGAAVDLLAMGRPEGPGCYCPVNHMLREIIDRLGRSYDYVVIDNEAGMEHLSRRTTRDVDLLVVTTDPTLRGIRAAEGIAGLARELHIQVGRAVLVLNRAEAALPAPLSEALNAVALEWGGSIPADPLVTEFDAIGRPLVELGPESPAAQAVEALADRLLGNREGPAPDRAAGDMTVSNAAHKAGPLRRP